MVKSYTDQELLNCFSKTVGRRVDMVFVREFRKEMRRNKQDLKSKSVKELLKDYFENSL